MLEVYGSDIEGVSCTTSDTDLELGDAPQDLLGNHPKRRKLKSIANVEAGSAVAAIVNNNDAKQVWLRRLSTTTLIYTGCGGGSYCLEAFIKAIPPHSTGGDYWFS